VFLLFLWIKRCRQRNRFRHHEFHNPIIRYNEPPRHPNVRPVCSTEDNVSDEHLSAVATALPNQESSDIGKIHFIASIT